VRPPFNPATSDGCSVPTALRLLIQRETPAQIAVCVHHDGDYYYGGSRRDRAVADAKLLLGLLRADMDIDLAHEYHLAVRAGGKAHWNDGAGVLGRYSDDPTPTDVTSRSGEILEGP